MPRKSSVNDNQLIESIKELYGSEITTGDLRGFCASRNLNYQTICRHLENYKIGRGRWNLEVTPTVVNKMEQAYQAPAALPAVEQNLIPDKDLSLIHI